MARRWIALLAIGLAAIAGLYLLVRDPHAGAGGGDDGALAAAREGLLTTQGDPTATGPGLEGRAGSAPLRAEGATPLPPPVDLKRVDRERDLHGVVVRDDGQPVAGATLQVVHFPWRYGSLLTDGRHQEERAGPRTRSARDGTFALRLNRGALVHLRVFAADLATTEYARMQAGEFVRVVLKEPVRLIVKASTPQGEPAASLELHLFRSAREGVSFEREGMTGADGLYVFEDLPPGGSAWLDPRPRHEGWGDPGWITLELPERGDLTHALTLPEGRTLTGRVTDAATGKPLEGARVGMNWVLVPEVRTGPDGRYVLPGWTGTGVDDVHVLAQGYGRAQVVVGAQEVLDFALRAGASVRGRVLGLDGAGLAGAQVAAVGSTRQAGEQEISMDSGYADAEGRFTLSGLRRDLQHTLIVDAPGHARLLRVLPPSSASEANDLGDLRLAPGRVLNGTLTLAAREPVPRVHISARLQDVPSSGYSYGRAWERASDDLGRFTFTDLPAGTYALSARPAGRPGVTQTVVVTDTDAPTSAQLVLEAGRPVRIHVVDDEGKPLAGVYVSAQGTGPRGGAQGRTDAEGVCTLQLPAEPIQLNAFLPDGPPRVMREPTTVAAEQTEVEVVLAAAATTTGVLRTPDGKPLPWALVSVERGEEMLTNLVTDAQGRFRHQSPPGDVLAFAFSGMVAEGSGKPFGSRPLSARADGVRAGTQDVRLDSVAVPTDGSLTVIVLDPQGQPVENIPVSLSPNPVDGRRRKTDAKGRVDVDGLHRVSTQVSLGFATTAEQPWRPPPPTSVLPEGQTLTLRLRTGVSIEGTLLTAEGEPAQAGGVMVYVGPRYLGSAQVDRDGGFVVVVGPEESGPFTLRATLFAADRSVQSAVLEDVRPGATNLELRFAKAK